MRLVALALVALSLGVGQAAAQVAPPPAKGTEPVQHGAQPNAGEVRRATPEGDAPSAAAGDLVRRQERRVLGLPITTALVVAAVILALLAVAGIVIPSASRRRRARGGGTYGRR